jgi:hypothetical protein
LAGSPEAHDQHDLDNWSVTIPSVVAGFSGFFLDLLSWIAVERRFSLDERIADYQHRSF